MFGHIRASIFRKVQSGRVGIADDNVAIRSLSVVRGRKMGRQQLVRQVVVIGLLLVMPGILVATLMSPRTADASTGIEQEMSFEGKIVTSTGQNIPDGTYNMEFRIYSGCTNEPTSNAGCTAVWTEDWLNNNSQGVTFTSGTYQVDLGAICAFTTSTCENNANTAVNWNSYPLYVSLQIGNTSNCSVNNPGSSAFTADCGGDGEMNPYVLLSSTPYSFNSNELGGLTASQFGQIAANNTWTGSNVIQVASTSAFEVQPSAGGTAVLNIDTTNGQADIGTTTGQASLTVQGSTTTSASNSLSINDSGGNNLVQVRNDGQVLLGKTATNTSQQTGHTSIGANPDNGFLHLVIATKITTGSSVSNLTSISAYVQAADVSPNNKYILGIYTDNSGTPGSLIASSAQGTLTAAAWNTLSVSTGLSANTSYWLAFSTNTTSNTISFVPYDTGSGTNHAYMTSYANAGVTLPSSFTANGTGSVLDSIYATASVVGPLGTAVTISPTNGVNITTPTNTSTALSVTNASSTSVFSVDDTSSGHVNLSTAAATSSTTAISSPALSLQSAEWNGSSSVSSTYYMLNVASTSSPTYELALQNNSKVTVMSLDGNGNATFQNSSNSSTAFQVAYSGTTGNLLAADTSAGQVTINSSGNNPLTLNVNTATNEDGILYKQAGSVVGEMGIAGAAGQIINQTAAGDLGIKNLNGNIYLSAGNSTAGQNNGEVKIDTNGNVTLQNTANSTTAFKVQNSTPASIFTVDTTTDSSNDTGQILVGAGSAGESSGTKPVLLVTDNSNTEPSTAVNGAIYYNTLLNNFRCGQNGLWVNCSGIPIPNTARSVYSAYDGLTDSVDGALFNATYSPTAADSTFPATGDTLTANSVGISPVAATSTTPEMALITSGSTSGNTMGLFSSFAIYNSSAKPITFQAYVKNVTTTSVRDWIGITSASNGTMGGSATPTASFAAFRYDTSASDTSYKCVTGNGTTDTVDGSSGIAAGSGHKFEIDLTSSSAIFKIDGAVVCGGATTNTLPASNTNLSMDIAGETLTNAAATMDIAWLYMQTAF